MATASANTPEMNASFFGTDDPYLITIYLIYEI